MINTFKDTLTHALWLRGDDLVIKNLTALSEKGSIKLDVSKLLSDSELRIGLIDITSQDMIKYIVGPIVSSTRPDVLNMENDNTLYFWWD